MPHNQADITQFMQHQYLCETLTVKEIETLLEFTEAESHQRGEVIAEVGEVGEALFFLIRGHAELRQYSGEEHSVVGVIKAGEMMGEMSFFDRKPRSLSIVAAEDDTRLLRLTRAKYKRFRVEHPYITVNLLEHAIISQDHLFRDMAAKDASLKQYILSMGGKR